MKHLILTLFLTAATSMGFAQFSKGQPYSKAKVYLKDHQVLIVKDLKINDLEVNFLNIANKKNENLAMDRVNFIKIKKGSHVWDGALYGSLSMALSAVLIDIDNDPLTKPKKFGAIEYIGFAGIGVGLGALIGSLFPKWKNIYSNGRFIGQNFPLKLNLGATADLAIIEITIPL